MVIPNYSKPDDWERFNALGVSQYGQMTAGSFMYIGPQGIVHGTTITVLNAGRKISKHGEGLAGKLFITAGLGGMSGAQPKAGNIAGCISITAEINPKATHTRHSQGWVDEVIDDLDKLVERVKVAREKKETVSIAYQGTWWTCGNVSRRVMCLLNWDLTRRHCITRGLVVTIRGREFRGVQADDGRGAGVIQTKGTRIFASSRGCY